MRGIYLYLRVFRHALVLLIAAVCLAVGAFYAFPASAKEFEPPQSNCPGQRYSDVCPSDWFYEYVEELSDLGAVSGYDDGTFRPDNTITRGQMMKVIVIAADLTATIPPEPTFADVPATHPFFNWIETGAVNGVAAGYSDGTFRPATNISRGQLAKMIVGAMDWTTLNPATPTFRDVPRSNAFFGFIERAVEQGVVGGYPCGGRGEPCSGRYFRPYNTTTRAQACKILSLANGLGWTPTATATGTPPTTTPTRTRTSTRTSTRTFTRTPTATATSAAIWPCPLFPANNIWNRNIAALPTHALSNNYVNSIGRDDSPHADFGSGLWEGGPIGIPFIFVPGNQPRVPVRFLYDDESDPGPYPIPTNAPIEGGPDSDGDRHVIVVDRDACIAYETYYSWPQFNGSWDADSGARWDLDSNALRPDGWTSGDAAGLPILPGLVTYDEVASGAIRHAIRFTVPRTQRAYLWPARHYASSNTDPNLPPMGLRLRLKANVDILGYPIQMRVILQALKDYGMFVSDNGSPWYITGAPDERWDNEILHLLDENIHGYHFEAIDESGLMVDPNSGQSR